MAAMSIGKLMATWDRLRATSLEMLSPSTPDSFAAYIKTETGRWAVIVKNSGVELESQVVAMLTALACRRGVRSGCSI